MVKKKKKNQLYLEPTERLLGIPSFDIYSQEIQKASPSIRKQLLKERKASVQKATKEEARKRLGIPLTEVITKYKKRQEQIQAKKEFKRYLIRKQFEQAPVSSTIQQQQIISQRARQRQRIMGTIGSRAERLELWGLSINETPLLHNIENQRMRACSPPNRFIEGTERSVTNSFPD